MGNFCTGCGERFVNGVCPSCGRTQEEQDSMREDRQSSRYVDDYTEQPVYSPAPRYESGGQPMPAQARRNPLLYVVIALAALLCVALGYILAGGSQRGGGDTTVTPTTPYTGEYTTPATQPVTEPGEPDETEPEDVSPSLSVGDHITMGRYKQSSSNSYDPIEWRVLDVEGDRALVISEDILDDVQYGKAFAQMTYADCKIHNWLNKSFYNTAFNAEEKGRILTTMVRNPNNPYYDSVGGADTDDKVFLLSTEEAEKYFSSDTDRIAAVTSYSRKQGVHVSDDKRHPDGRQAGYWWLRTPGMSNKLAAGVHRDGSVDYDGCNVDSDNAGVRPAMWISI